MVIVASVGIGCVCAGVALILMPAVLNLRRSWIRLAGGVLLIAGLACVASPLTAASL